MDASVRVTGDRLFLTDDFAVSFQRTLRVPDDGHAYPLPPGLGALPIKRVADYKDRVPADWLRLGGAFIPLFQREALWLGFTCPTDRPTAVKIGVGAINALTGAPWDDQLHASPQDYLVCPDQPWLDGINAGGIVRQFVAMPLGDGYSIEGQLTGTEEIGGIQIRGFHPKAGWMRPDQADERKTPVAHATTGAMGIAPGGRITQKIYPDPFGIDTWDQTSGTEVFVHLVNSAEYLAITGSAPPPSPIDAAAYSRCGLPWFALYDESHGQIPASEQLAVIRSTGELDSERGKSSDESPFEVGEQQIRNLKPPSSERRKARDPDPRDAHQEL